MKIFHDFHKQFHISNNQAATKLKMNLGFKFSIFQSVLNCFLPQISLSRIQCQYSPARLSHHCMGLKYARSLKLSYGDIGEEWKSGSETHPSHSVTARQETRKYAECRKYFLEYYLNNISLAPLVARNSFLGFLEASPVTVTA